MKVSRRNFLKTSAICGASVALMGFSLEHFPRKYHKITKDWSISCGTVTNWNNMEVYSKVGLSKDNNHAPREMDTLSEYVLRSQNSPFIYVNKDKHYEISNYKGGWIGGDHSLFEVSFDIVKYLGNTPKERIIIISGYDYCIYALGKDYYKESVSKFGKGWSLDRHEVYTPITKNMHSKIKYFDFNRKTYQEYLKIYNTKLKELNLI